MEVPPLDAELAKALTDPARKGIVNALDQAYAVRSALHDPSIGDDNQSFGFLVYKSECYFLSRFVEEDGYEEGLSLFEPGQLFALQAGRFVLAPYRLPYRPWKGPEKVFPYNQNGAGFLAQMNYERLRQVSMFSDDHGPQVGIVIAHTGDSETGLQSVSLREPIEQMNGRITAWGHIERLWPDSEDDAEGGGGTPTFPPEEPISEPPIGLKEIPGETREGASGND